MNKSRIRESPHAEFANTILPVVERHCRHRWSWLSRDQHEEATQEARCHAWRIYLADWRKKATSESVAHYAASRWNAGRCFVQHKHTDIMGKPNRPTRAASLYRLPAELRVDHHSHDPAQTVATRLDYQDLMQRLTPKQRSVMVMLMHGHSLTEIARQLGISVRRVDWITHHVLPAELIRTFGVDIIPRNSRQRHCA